MAETHGGAETQEAAGRGKRHRYCPMCDEWLVGRECPKCGADTYPQEKAR